MTRTLAYYEQPKIFDRKIYSFEIRPQFTMLFVRTL
jgi:hypothetical protein